MGNVKTILTEDDLMQRWGIESPRVIARHREKGLRGFRVAHKKASGPGQSLWRYRLADVESYEERLIAESSAPPRGAAPKAPAPAVPIEGWDGVDRLRGGRRGSRPGTRPRG